MTGKSGLAFKIEEITTPRSEYLVGMGYWLEQIFPEYCPPIFDRLLMNLRRPEGKHQIQVFIAPVGEQVAGLVQVFYRRWQDGLLADIDLLGVLEPYRRQNLAASLVQQAIQATTEMARQWQIPAAGVVTLIDPKDTAIVGLHQKLGGQIREDYLYASGDQVVWYPLNEVLAHVPTSILGEQLQNFGQLLVMKDE